MASALVTVNGAPCVRATIRLPRAGVWFADLVVDATQAITGRVSVSVSDGALVLNGTASRSGTFKDTAVLRVLAGAGGMTKTVKAKFFRNAAVRTVLQHILGAAGEQLSGSAASKLLERQLGVYTVREQAAGAALSQLAEYLEVTWRALPDGTIWLGDEAWPEATLPNSDVLTQDPRAQTVTIGTDSPTLLPGTVWGGRKVSMVEHDVSAERVRSTLWLERDGAGGLSDRLAQAVRSIVRALTAHMEYFAPYPAKVVSQNSDGTLELQPDNKRMPGLTKVPIRGLPGVRVEVASGARVNVEFENGDPAQPIAALFETHSLKKLIVDADTSVELGGGGAKAILKADGSIEVTPKDGKDVVIAGGNANVARKDDTTSSGQLEWTGTKLQWTPEGGGAATTILTYTAGSGGETLVAGTAATIAGKITSGAEHVKA